MGSCYCWDSSDAAHNSRSIGGLSQIYVSEVDIDKTSVAVIGAPGVKTDALIAKLAAKAYASNG